MSGHNKWSKIKQSSKRILGVDPGFDRVGIAVLDQGRVLFSECIVTNRKLSHEKRLLDIGKKIRKVIDEWEPKALAIEKLFFNQNVSTAMKVSEARGIIIYEAMQAGLEIYEYSPQEIKIAVTGYGKADKLQVERMVRKLVELPSKKMLDDELDAIALCITRLATRNAF